MQTTTRHIYRSIEAIQRQYGATPHRVLLSPEYIRAMKPKAIGELKRCGIPAEVISGQQEDFILEFATPEEKSRA